MVKCAPRGCAWKCGNQLYLVLGRARIGTKRCEKYRAWTKTRQHSVELYQSGHSKFTSVSKLSGGTPRMEDQRDTLGPQNSDELCERTCAVVLSHTGKRMEGNDVSL